MVTSGHKRVSGLIAGLLFLFGSMASVAQNGPPIMPQFEADAPKVGEPLPDVTIYDDLGNPVNLRELSDENYKVLVLGCLT
jgi:cytochrome oxidase Cu insertion factor (SCO1/SenC/PrrC family)